MATSSTGNGLVKPWRRRLTRGLLIAAAGLLLTGCGSPPDSAEPPPTPSASPSPHRGGSGGLLVEPPSRYCRSWLQALRPVNHHRLDYAVGSGLWDGTAPAFGGLEACHIRMRDAPAAAAAELDFIWAKLTISDGQQFAEQVPELPHPRTATNWDSYLHNQWHTVLRGELHCEALWTSADEYATDSDLADCDIGGEVDGQRFAFEFAAVHRGVYLAATIDYYTTNLSEPAETDAAGHTMDLFTAFATTVANSLPAE